MTPRKASASRLYIYRTTVVKTAPQTSLPGSLLAAGSRSIDRIHFERSQVYSASRKSLGRAGLRAIARAKRWWPGPDGGGDLAAQIVPFYSPTSRALSCHSV